MLVPRRAHSALLCTALLAFPSPLQAFPLNTRANSKANYISNAENAAGVLNDRWFSSSNGRWENNWWNSANALTTLAGLAQVDSNYMSTAQGIWETVFSAAKSSNGGSWLNNYYDDEGWWAMAWIKVFDVTQNATYLDTAETIFEDLKGGLGGWCGGQWWDKPHTQTNSINNELYLAVGASLANRVSGKKSYYGDSASSQANWIFGSRLMNTNYTFEDGITSGCTSEGGLWTYNQGAILGALVEMQKLTGNSSYLDKAANIAEASMKTFDNGNGILTELQAYPTEDSTSEQFKGVFARNLAVLQGARGNGDYVSFLQTNANSIWANDRQSDGQLGADWQGPVQDTGAPAQSSALDCLVAAAIVS